MRSRIYIFEIIYTELVSFTLFCRQTYGTVYVTFTASFAFSCSEIIYMHIALVNIYMYNTCALKAYPIRLWLLDKTEKVTNGNAGVLQRTCPRAQNDHRCTLNHFSVLITPWFPRGMLQFSWVQCLLLLGVVVCCTNAKPPNIVFIVADDLG